jgi:predicted nucleic acid-binding Zn ribbon protein
MSSELLKECPKCKGLVKRLIGTGSGPIFKGSGFYHTDYKNKPANSASSKKEDKKEEKKEEKKETKSSDKDSKSPDASEKK